MSVSLSYEREANRVERPVVHNIWKNLISWRYERTMKPHVIMTQGRIVYLSPLSSRCKGQEPCRPLVRFRAVAGITNFMRETSERINDTKDRKRSVPDRMVDSPFR